MGLQTTLQDSVSSKLPAEYVADSANLPFCPGIKLQKSIFSDIFQILFQRMRMPFAVWTNGSRNQVRRLRSLFVSAIFIPYLIIMLIDLPNTKSDMISFPESIM